MSHVFFDLEGDRYEVEVTSYDLGRPGVDGSASISLGDMVILDPLGAQIEMPLDDFIEVYAECEGFGDDFESARESLERDCLEDLYNQSRGV